MFFFTKKTDFNDDQFYFDRAAIVDFKHLRRKIFKTGFIVVRDLVSTNVINEYKTKAEDSFFKSQQILEVLGIRVDENLSSINEARITNFLNDVALGQVNNDVFEKFQGIPMSDLLMGDSVSRKFVESLLGGVWYPGASNLRRVSPNLDIHGKHYQKPIHMHCDAPYLSKHTYSLNFWLPTVAVPSDAPGLQLSPGTIDEMRRGYKHSWSTLEFDRDEAENIQAFYTQGKDQGKRFVPHLKPGDAVVFHNWVMHGSWATSNMKVPRISYEIRFNAPDLDMFESFAE